MGQNKSKIKTIISASRRTDIPAFYYDWLQAVLAAGTAIIPNPLFPEKTYAVDLRPENVHSVVLWSKDFRNAFSDPMRLQDYNLYFQYTINNYSRLLEPNVPCCRDTIAVLEGLLRRYRPEQFNIRFDPVIISITGEANPVFEAPEKARLAVFKQLCTDLKTLGMETCRITTSYICMYRHVKSRLTKLCQDIIDLNEADQIHFFEQMAETAEKYGLQLYSCASPILEKVNGIRRGHCIDGELLESLFGGKVTKAGDKGQRESCGCSMSRDIGIYPENENGMKCRHGCVYCYVAGKGSIK